MINQPTVYILVSADENSTYSETYHCQHGSARQVVIGDVPFKGESHLWLLQNPQMLTDINKTLHT